MSESADAGYLVVDVGGTKTLVALARRQAGTWVFSHRQRYPSSNFTDLPSLLHHWLGQHRLTARQLRAGALAIAGPVWGRGTTARSRATNLDWPDIHATALTEELGFPVCLLNDFQAIGASLASLGPEDTLTLQTGQRQPDGLRLVVGIGTGLGTCLIGPPPEQPIFAGEGGHAILAPADQHQAALAAWISTRQQGPCRREDLLSGGGIAHLAAYHLHHQPDATDLTQALHSLPAGAAIQGLAEQGHPLALQIVTDFVQIFAGQLADMALTALPYGGIYLAGGVIQHWQAFFQHATFTQAFANRPPMQDVLADLPIELIVHPEPGLLGAAVAAVAAEQAIQAIVETNGNDKPHYLETS